MLEKITELKASLVKIDELISLSNVDNSIDKKDLLKERKFCLNEIKIHHNFFSSHKISLDSN